ncbi:larval cuticle protein LCP-30-like [Diorhabda sublineata]|uniref:larval cuticle protein LCP-30-like n=1 Tax=Diorhabda sublineata TaxID=1163346 RepID=UPI0024E0B10C|nr:larval cuticle protein LCP-30-like [Diorhabda sublineata]
MKKWILFYFFITVSLVSIQCLNDEDDGQYHPDDEGRYIHDDSGRYIPDYSGLYHDDGTGRYAHIDSEYNYLLSISDRRFYTHQRDRQYPYKSVNSLKSFNNFQSRGKIASDSFIKNKLVQPTISVVTETPAKYRKYDDNRWKIIRLASDVNSDGFHWEYETENEISGEENAKIHNSGTKDETISTKGFYQYTGTDNKVYNVEYTADENGFIPRGSHLHPILQKAILENLNRKDI